MATGTIRSLRVDKGFGFIKDAQGQEYFFHQSAIYGEGINDLREGDSVEFEIGNGLGAPHQSKRRVAAGKPPRRRRPAVFPILHGAIE